MTRPRSATRTAPPERRAPHRAAASPPGRATTSRAPSKAKAAAKGTRSNPEARRSTSPRVRRRRLTVATLVFAVLVAGFLVAFVYPTRTFVGQRDELKVANQRLEVLRAETKRLNEASRDLQNDSEVARIAREQYGLVLPGETPYVPVEITPTTPTTTAP